MDENSQSDKSETLQHNDNTKDKVIEVVKLSPKHEFTN